MYLLGDYNLNVLDYNNNTMFRHGIISLINKPTHIATAIDNIFTNKYFNTNRYNKTDISDYFPIFFIDNDISSNPQQTILKKIILTDTNTKINNSQTKLSNINWSDVLKLKNSNDPLTYS